MVGFLGAVSDDKLTSAFEMRLRDRGWIVGQNLSIEYRWADGDLARLSRSLKRNLYLRPVALYLFVASNSSRVSHLPLILFVPFSMY